MRSIFQDVRLALRGFRKEPRFVVVAALTLALGIGCVTAIFSVVNGVLLKPLPYRDAGRLANIWSNADGLSLNRFPLSPDLYVFFKNETHSFENMTVFRRRDASLTETGNPEVVPSLEASFSYFPTMGITPAMGQLFTAEHDVRGAPLVTVMSHRLWQRRFAADPHITGKQIRIDGETATVLGVLPKDLDDNGSPDLWVPNRFDAANPPTGNFGWNAAARLKPGIRAETAQDEFIPLVKRLTDGGITGPDYRAFLTNGRYRVIVNSLSEDLVGDLRRPLWILLGTVGFVLLIACANVANLFLIRAEGRQREVSVRAALGATRAALIRKQLVEAVVLAVIGGGLGVGLASIGIPALLRAAPATIPRLAGVRLDPIVLLVAAGATLLAALIFGIAPAIRYTRLAALGSLRHGGRGSTSDKRRQRGRKVLVVIQTALTLVLLVGSGLLVRSFSRMLHADIGFDPAQVMTFRVALPASSYPDTPRVLEFERRLTESLTSVAGVTSAGASSVLPMLGGAPGTAFVIDGQPTPPGQLPPILHYKITVPGYVETMGLKLLQGRTFDRRDLAQGDREILVNKALADTFWKGVDPIGKRLRPSGDQGNDWYTVAGVVSSEKQNGFREEPPLLIYFAVGAPYGTGSARTLAYVVKGPQLGNRMDALRQAVWNIDPQLPVAAMQPMDEIVSRSIVPFTFTMLALGIAAGMALILGMVGLYGVLSYAVTLRVREIGVRLALGAPPRTILRSIVGQGLVIVGIGLIVGFAGAYGLTRVLADLLYDTKPLDLPTLAGTGLLLTVVAVLASYVPARRAAGVSPLESLRSE